MAQFVKVVSAIITPRVMYSKRDISTIAKADIYRTQKNKIENIVKLVFENS